MYIESFQKHLTQMETGTAEKLYVIESETQYKKYCELLERILSDKKKKTVENKRTIKLLTLLIETWEEENSSVYAGNLDPVELLDVLMKENNVSQTTLAHQLQISKSIVSEVLHYKRGMSKELIRGLSVYFSVSQEAFNKPYALVR